MDKGMIKLWNETVNEDDMVIIMGDFIKRREPEYALSQIIIIFHKFLEVILTPIKILTKLLRLIWETIYFRQLENEQ